MRNLWALGHASAWFASDGAFAALFSCMRKIAFCVQGYKGADGYVLGNRVRLPGGFWRTGVPVLLVRRWAASNGATLKPNRNFRKRAQQYICPPPIPNPVHAWQIAAWLGDGWRRT